MLAIRRSAGVASEVNLRNLLHAGKKACRQGIHPGFETQGRYHQKSKTEVDLSVVPQKGLASSKKFIYKKQYQGLSSLLYHLQLSVFLVENCFAKGTCPKLFGLSERAAIHDWSDYY